MKKFHSVAELAEATGFSSGTIHKKIADGTIFAVQANERGAFRIPAYAFEDLLASLGLRDRHAKQLLPPTEFHVMGPDEVYALHIAPALARDGYEDVPALLRAIEGDPLLLESYEDVIRSYNDFLTLRAGVAVKEAALSG